MEFRGKIGFVLGPLVFILILLLPFLPQNPIAHSLLAVFSLVVVFWVTECIPIPVTALSIPILLTLLGITPIKGAFAPFANPIIMLFLGSFILARAMCLHALDRKLAFAVLSMKAIAGRRLRILIALGCITAFLSLWISNTATTAMMFPIALGILDAFRSKAEDQEQGAYTPGLLLSLAYAASIGGIGSPIGSPPNLIAIGMMEKLAGYRITFFQWMMIGFCVLLPMLLFLFLYMRLKIGKEVGDKKRMRTDGLAGMNAGGALTRGQKNVLFAFGITVSLWVFPGFVSLFWGKDTALYLWFNRHLPESAAALLGACLLFVLPGDWKKGKFTISLKDAMRVDWGTLLLFGGGLSLGVAMFETGLADAMGRFIISLGGESAGLGLVCFLAVTLSVFLTELTSNTASANMIIPIIIAVSQALSINPLPPVIGSAIGCSFAFMLPVATPPNAIVYGSERIRLPLMIRTGFWLNIAGIVIIWAGVMIVAPLLGLI